MNRNMFINKVERDPETYEMIIEACFSNSMVKEACEFSIKALQEKNDTISIESKDNRSLYEEENKKAITFKNKANMWKVATYIMTIIAIIAIAVTIF